MHVCQCVPSGRCHSWTLLGCPCKWGDYKDATGTVVFGCLVKAFYSSNIKEKQAIKDKLRYL